MIYLSPSATYVMPGWGQLLTPQSRTRGGYLRDGAVWGADNCQYTGKVTPGEFFTWLGGMQAHRDTCRFVACPDVVGDAVATLDRFRWFAWRIKALGFPVALVAQDGLEGLRWPPEYDALFVGGSTDWKLSDAADWCIRRAKAAGAWIHVGRVNSQKRIRHFQLIGADSADGTGICFAPDQRIPQLQAALWQRPLLGVA